MSQSWKQKFPLRKVLAGLGLAVTLGITGCQYQVGGQTLPSPYYMTDDVQYFAPGPEFKLEREAAALRQARAEQMLPRQ
jgi:hypothetical protein